MRKKSLLALTGITALFALTACGGGDATPNADDQNGDSPVLVKVGASAVPHAQILEFVDENLAEEAGIDLEIEEIDDYQIPNQALSDGDIDANFFQHLPFFEDQVETKGFDLEHGEGVHLEPLTAFSKKYDSGEDVPEEAVVVINNDPANQIRGLRVLEAAGLLNDIEDEDTALSVQDDEAKNPKKLQFNEVQAEQSPRLYQEDDSVDIAIVNGNYILQANLDLEEALQVEPAEDNPYSNFLTWRTGDKTDAITTLDELLHSEEVREFIETTWDDGSVIPAF